jgi:cytochrome c-type biogenesis protein CcmE
MGNKIFTAFVVVFAALAIVLVVRATSSSSTKVTTVAELSKLGTNATAKRIQLGARVSAEPQIDYKVEPKIFLKFSVQDPGVSDGPTIPVEYAGLKPDMFAAGRDVIVSGDLIDGRFVAAKLLTQCPSKYEPPKPTE